MGDHVARPVHLDGVVAADLMGAVRAGAAPQRSRPPHEQVPLLGAAEEDVVGNVEVARTRVLGPDSEPDVLEAAVPDREPGSPGDILESSEYGYVRVAEREAVEDVMGRGGDIEEPVVAGSVEHDIAIAGGANRDRSLWRRLDGEPVRAVERRHHRIDVVQPVVPVKAGVHQDGVAGLHGAFPHDAPVAEAGSVVGLQQAREVGLQLLALVIRGIDVPDLPSFERLRLGPGRDADGLDGLAGRTVRIAQLEAAFVLRALLEVQDAAGKAVRNGVVEVFPLAEDTLAADPDQRKRFAPGRVASLPEGDRHGGVAVLVASDGPLESEIVERRVLHGESARLSGVLGQRRDRKEGGKGQRETHMARF